MDKLEEIFFELIKRASTSLPLDVRDALKRARDAEDSESVARGVFEQLLKNVELAEKGCSPICQDTGTPILYVDYGPEFKEKELAEAFKEALKKATLEGIMRPNAVDPVTGKNSGDNTGVAFPVMHFHQRDEAGFSAHLMLKGGGSENVSTQYKLPDSSLGAGRDLNGVAKCVLDAVWKAQGKGCAPGILGVGIGGDRNTSYVVAKEQLFRHIGHRSADPKLAELEKKLLKQCNEMGIGPMGFGGRTTVLDVKIGACHRLPACYFVSIAYLCWAARRWSVDFDGKEVRYA